MILLCNTLEKLINEIFVHVQVWDISTGDCISIFGQHAYLSLGVCWVAQPQLPHHVLSGGGEFCLRLWDIYQHKAEDYAGELRCYSSHLVFEWIVP